MNRDHVKKLLTQLHAELSDTVEVDGELKTLLQDLNTDIHHVLTADQAKDDPVYTALSERSVALSAKFAAEHPTLEPVLRELGSMLAKMGI